MNLPPIVIGTGGDLLAELLAERWLMTQKLQLSVFFKKKIKVRR